MRARRARRCRITSRRSACPDADTLAARILSDEARKQLIAETSRARELLAVATATRDDAEKRLAAVAATRPHDADAEESTRAEVEARGKALESRRGACTSRSVAARSSSRSTAARLAISPR